MDFPALRHEPVNEQGVVLLFWDVATRFGLTWSNQFKLVSPIARRNARSRSKRWQRVNLEFEFESRISATTAPSRQPAAT